MYMRFAIDILIIIYFTIGLSDISVVYTVNTFFIMHIPNKYSYL